mgnify:CR=1 FL=1
MRIITLILLLILITGCTAVRIGKEDIKETNEVITENTSQNQSMIKSLEKRIEQTLPKISTETQYDTPSIVENRALKETESESFGDVI